MSKVLLNDEQIKEFIKSQGWIFDSPTKETDLMCQFKTECKAQLKAVVEYLEQPCTEHPIGEYHCGKPEPKAPVVKWVYKLGFLYLHRRDCPVCWAELKGEL